MQSDPTQSSFREERKLRRNVAVVVVAAFARSEKPLGTFAAKLERAEEHFENYFLVVTDDDVQ